MSSYSQAVCWVVTAGTAGMENQCLGLAERLGFQPVVKRVVLRTPYRQLAPYFRFCLSGAFSQAGDPVSAPWPDLLIASGRAGATACLLARRMSGKAGGRRTFTVHIQNPVIDASRFDLVAVPRHDGLLGDNVITTRGSLHRVTPELLKREAAGFSSVLDSLPFPRIAVLIGGSNSVYQLTPLIMAKMAKELNSLAKETGGSLLVTTSRRTGQANIECLKQYIAQIPHILWTGEGPNPYYAFLAHADAILVTADSVNMTSEACSTGKPVHVIGLEGGSEKFRLFHQALRDDGLTRPFTGKLEKWSCAPLHDVELVANRVREMMGIS